MLEPNGCGKMAVELNGGYVFDTPLGIDMLLMSSAVLTLINKSAFDDLSRNTWELRHSCLTPPLTTKRTKPAICPHSLKLHYKYCSEDFKQDNSHRSHLHIDLLTIFL